MTLYEFDSVILLDTSLLNEILCVQVIMEFDKK